MKIGDIFRDSDQPWMYPFTKIVKDPIEGYFIDWENEHGLIPDPSLVNIGDLISDSSLNATPYWKVTGVFDNFIYIDPFGDNPFLTGVGAGGAILTDHDWRVFSGEAEKEIIDRKLQKIQNRQYADYSDISYILLGTQPFRFGPNGSEGGWYTATDWGTRGHIKGLSPEEIMMQDAATLQKLGLEVPTSALNGTLKPHTWNTLVGGSDELNLETKLPSEDWEDPLVCARLVLTHPQPQIRKRNATALIDLAVMQKELSKTINRLWSSAPSRDEVDQTTYDRINKSIREKIDTLKEEWQGDPELLELCYEVAENLYDSSHPTYNLHDNFDAYWYIKEKFINLAKHQCWIDILRLYSTARDSTNRKYAVLGLSECNDHEGLVDVVEHETHPEPLAAALRALKPSTRGEENKDPTKFFFRVLESNLKHILHVANPGPENDPDNYYREQLSKFVKNSFAAREYYREHGFWPWFLD